MSFSLTILRLNAPSPSSSSMQHTERMVIVFALAGPSSTWTGAQRSVVWCLRQILFFSLLRTGTTAGRRCGCAPCPRQRLFGCAPVRATRPGYTVDIAFLNWMDLLALVNAAGGVLRLCIDLRYLCRCRGLFSALGWRAGRYG